MVLSTLSLLISSVSMSEELKKARERLADIYYRYHPPLKTSFLDDLEWVWGGKWGVNTEVGRLRKVLLHRPGREILAIKEPYEEWRYTYKPKLEEMVRDYESLKSALEQEGVEVIERLPEEGPNPRLVKSIYTRDPAFAIPGGVVIGRMYDRLRRGEEPYVMKTLAQIGCPIMRTINGYGVAEGGSFMWITPKHLALGLSWRMNEEGAMQIAEVVWAIDPDVDIRAEPIFGGHIDAHICMVDVKTAVVNREGLAYTLYEWLKEEVELNIIERPRDVYVAAVALRPGRVICTSGPGREEGIRLLERNGIDVVRVEIPTLVHPLNSGSIHCLTMPILRDPEPEG